MSTSHTLTAEALKAELFDAYTLQETRENSRIRGGDQAVGYKIACTNDAAQAFIGVEHPCYARLFASNQVTSATLPVHPDRPCGVECELAVYFARDVPAGSDPLDAIGTIAIAIEVVEDRYGGIATAGAPAVVADGFAHRGFILGQSRDYHGEALDAFSAEMLLDGKVVDRAMSANVLGSPANALRWLQQALADRQRALRAGEFVLTGSITPTFWLSRFPAHIECRLSDNLGSLQLVFAQHDPAVVPPMASAT